jgi:small-conductance mechanosensitive channel
LPSTLWKRNKKVFPTLLAAIISAAIASHYGKMSGHHPGHKLISLIFVLAFIIFSTTFLHVLSSATQRFLNHRRFGTARSASIKFTVRISGYLLVAVITLGLLNVSIGKLLLGGAVIGIILGVAAQQALGNFFASIVLIIEHPFVVGDSVSLISGALGGEYKGTVVDIGLTHTKLRNSEDEIIALPNATILSNAAIRKIKIT